MFDLKNHLYTDIATILAEKHPLTAKEIHETLKAKGLNHSYQYVHKSLNSLVDHQLITKTNSKFTLNMNYLISLKDFLIKASNQYDLDQTVFIQSITGSLLKVFNEEDAENIAQNLLKQVNHKIMERLDEWYTKYYDPERKEINAIFDQADFKNKVILELGCGTGRITKEIVKKAKSVIAVDHNKDAIEYSKEKFKNQKNITFVHQSIYELKNLSQQEFDIILSGWSGIHHAKDMKGLITKVQNLLKENGTLILIESYPESEYVAILNMLKPRETKIREKQELLTRILFEKFKSVDKKIISPRYVFPNYEKLEETFKIELVYEEGARWDEKDSAKLQKYVEDKKDLVIGEAFIMFTCKKEK